MLTKIAIKNFRGIKELEINNLGKVNVFIGKNNSGKSSILDALCLAKCVFNDRLFDESVLKLLLQRKGVERSQYTVRSLWRNYNTQENIQISLGFAENIDFNIEIRWISDERLRMLVEEPSHSLRVASGSKYLIGREISLTQSPFTLEGSLGTLAFAQNYPQVYQFLSELVLIDDYLARKLERLEKNIFSKILESGLDKKLVQFLKETYDINAEGLTHITLSSSLSHFVLATATPKASIGIDELGDGAKYAAAILSLCLLLENTALLVEEVESHQHAGAIEKLLSRLLQAAEENNVQLFITTHSFEVIRVLTKLSDRFDIRFFHVQKDDKGETSVRYVPSADAQVLLDLGIDLRHLDLNKKFIVVEGDEDALFIQSLLERYGRRVDELGYLVKARGKSEIKSILASLLSAHMDILVLIDYDDKKDEDLQKSISEAFKSKGLKVEVQQGNVLKVNDRIVVTLIPLGLPNDEELKKAGITWHEREDYLLKILDVDKEVKEWLGIDGVKELVERGKHARVDGVNKSSVAFRLLAVIKGISYDEAVEEIIKRASEKTLDDILPQALKEIIHLKN